MKRLFFLIILILTFSISALFAHVRLNAPVDGSTMIIGGTISISWQQVQDHGESNWDLYFSSDGGSTWNEIQLNIDKSQLILNWTVPNIETTNAKIKIIQDNTSDMNYEDISEAFSITTGSVEYVKILSPIAGIQFTPSEITNISWEMFQTTGLVNWDLYLSTDDGSTWSELQMNIDANILYYKWTIPDVASTTAKIKVVYDNSGTTEEAISEAFTISGTTSDFQVVENSSQLFSNYPNPFSGQTKFVLNLENKTNVLLELYSLNGLKLETILNKEMVPGEHKISWTSTKYSKGLYFCRMKAGENAVTNKLMVLE